MGYYIGIDGCKGGWVAALIRKGNPSLIYTETLEELRDLITDADLILIDMPMGLPSDGTSDRVCDREARTYLKKRKMSIFPIPSRDAVYSDTYEKATRKNRALTGKGLSKQAYNLFPKIREVDAFVLKDITITEKMYEGHPELSFTMMAGGDMVHSKKTSLGIEERLSILEAFLPQVRGLVEEFLSCHPKKTMVADDVIDALSLVLSLKVSQARGWEFIPKSDIRDTCEIPMRIFLLKREE